MKYIKSYNIFESDSPIKDMEYNESKNYSILYHYIPLYNLYLLLTEYKETGKFLLKTDFAGDRSNDIPVISLSRNSSMNSGDLLLSKQLCRIAIDGIKLSHKYKLRPYADSTHTKGSDNEHEEMLFISNQEYYMGYNIENHHVPVKYKVDITDYILQIDILTIPPKMKDTQGYMSWVNSHNQSTPKYYNHEVRDMDNIDQDHSTEINRLFKLLRTINLNFKVNVVSKFTNYKYQNRYIDRWNKRGFKINNFKKFNESYTSEIKSFSDNSDDGWVERTLNMKPKDFFGKYYTNKKHIGTEDNYDVYVFHDKDYDEIENEYFWEIKEIIKVEKRDDITHYFVKELINRPLYKVRDEDMTREQELKIRTWCGTSNTPKQGEFIGHEKGLSMFKSFLSDKNGALYHVLPDGQVLEMLFDDIITKEYLQQVLDYLLETRNFDLIPLLDRYTTSAGSSA